MSLSAVSHAETAAPLAALLPARLGEAWNVGPAPYGVRPNAATSRLTNGRRSLIVAESAGRIEVFTDEHDLFPVTPDAAVDAAGPDPVAALAARILRTVLPQLDTAVARRVRWDKGWHQALINKAADLTELGFILIDHGAHPRVRSHVDGPALTWTTPNGAVWDVLSLGADGTFTVAYDGLVRGLYGLLPVLLAPFDGVALPDVTSAFTWHLTDRFPQIRGVNAAEVDFGAQGEPYGFIVLPSEDTPTDRADDSTHVAAQFGGVGADLLLAAASHLV